MMAVYAHCGWIRTLLFLTKKDFDILTWFKSRQDAIKLLGIDTIEYEIINTGDFQ